MLDEDLAVVKDADEFLRHVRFGRDNAELTTKAYAGGIALFLRWCRLTGRDWTAGVEQFGLFVTWLRHAGPEASGPQPATGGQVLAGPAPPQRVARAASTRCSRRSGGSWSTRSRPGRRRAGCCR